jgi:hypothetical protein
MSAEVLGIRDLQVQQFSEVKLLWLHYELATWMHVLEDQRNPDCLVLVFRMTRSVRHSSSHTHEQGSYCCGRLSYDGTVAY